MRQTLLTLVFYTVHLCVNAQTTLIPYNSSWKYLANGTDQGTAWRSTTFDDAAWASGLAQLGYGDGDEATVVSFGPDAANKYVTTYFRKTISVTNPSSFASIEGNVKRDDGVVVYVNGVEVFRDNVPTGATFTTLAPINVADDGLTPQPFSFNSSVLVAGNNTIAVEIHQTAVSSSDMSFDLELKGTTNPLVAGLTRGPYLNMGNQNAVTLRWRTSLATDTKVELGTTHGTYPTVFSNATATTEHEIRLTGLTSDTKYFYRFGSSSTILQAGTDNFFLTAPPTNTTRKLRFAVFGDCGRNDGGIQTQNLAAYQAYLGSNAGETMILLGDNAYDKGLDGEYQTGFFAPYQESILKNHVLMPAPGNHDYANNITEQKVRTGAYYQNFTLPTQAECGGIASNTEAYYSWDRGDVHFLSLDSYGTESTNNYRLYDTLGPQVVWLKQDLAANTKKWTILYWHHPPYTMGSHNSDTEGDLANFRNNLLRILERYGVDLVLCGHSHNYERYYLLKGHYGNEASFNLTTHAVSNSSAKYDGSTNSCPYNLPNGQVNHGIVYVVAGSAGGNGLMQTSFPHSALPWAFNDGGILSLEIQGNRLDAKFVRRDQVIADRFTLMKDVNKTTNLTVSSSAPIQLKASWLGNYTWNTTTATTQNITVSPTTNRTYTVTDNMNCLTDVFNVNLSSVLPLDLLNFEAKPVGKSTKISWKTANEQNVDYFEIEHSPDSKAFTPLSKLAAKNTQLQSYEVMDEKPLSGVSYYRLKIAHLDGHLTYSPVESVVFEENNANKVHIYPNPASDKLTIEVTSKHSEPIVVNLFNRVGQLVYSHTLDSKIGVNRVNINTGLFPKGLYVLKTKQSNVMSVEKIVIR
jgi:acid phosphatase type 7